MASVDQGVSCVRAVSSKITRSNLAGLFPPLTYTEYSASSYKLVGTPEGGDYSSVLRPSVISIGSVGQAVDTTPPAFTGIQTLTGAANSSMTATWLAATDDTTPADQLVYEVHVGNLPGLTFMVRAAVQGLTSVMINDLFAGTYYVRVRVRDKASNISSSIGPELSVTFDTPSIQNVYPEPGTFLQPTDAVLFDVVAPTSLLRVVIGVSYPDGMTELIYDGTAFTALFLSSTKTLLSNGSHFRVLRVGGWKAAPSVRILAFAKDGGEL